MSSGVRSRDQAFAHELAVAQHGHFVAKGHHLAEFVGDDQDAELALRAHAADHAQQFVGLLRREHGGRLVEDQHVALQIELLEQLDLLLLAGGQVADERARIDAERHACP